MENTKLMTYSLTPRTTKCMVLYWKQEQNNTKPCQIVLFQRREQIFYNEDEYKAVSFVEIYKIFSLQQNHLTNCWYSIFSATSLPSNSLSTSPLYFPY